jgi:hypothetical protein
VRGVIDAPPREMLDEAQTFLTRHGYTVVQRSETSLTAQRTTNGSPAGQYVPVLTVAVFPQPEGGVRMSVRGNDYEGVCGAVW